MRGVAFRPHIKGCMPRQDMKCSHNPIALQRHLPGSTGFHSTDLVVGGQDGIWQKGLLLHVQTIEPR